MRRGFLPGYPVPREQWVEKGDSCPGCGKRFTFFTSKSNCPNCGRLYCSDCLQAECTIVPGGAPTQTCLPCFSMLQDFKRRQRAAQEEQRMQRVLSPAEAPAPPEQQQQQHRVPVSVPSEDGQPTTSAAPQGVSAGEYAEVREQLESLVAKSRELRAENEELVADLAQKEVVITEVTEALQAERDRAAAQEQRCHDLEDQVRLSQSESTKLSERVQELVHEANGKQLLAEEKCEAYQRELEEVKQAKEESERHSARAAEAATSTIADLERRVKELNAEVVVASAQANAEKQQLQEDLLRARSDLEQSRQQAEAARGEAEQAVRAREADAKELHSLREQLSSTTAELERHRAEVAQRSNGVAAALEESARRLTEERDGLQREVETLREALRRQEEESAQRASRWESTQADWATQAQAKDAEIDSLTRQNALLKEQLSATEQLQRDVQAAADTAAALSRVTALEEQVSSLQQSRDELHEALGAAQREASKAEAEGSRHREAISSAAREREAALSAQIAALEVQLASETARSAAAQEALAASEAKSETLRATVEELTAARERAESARAAAESAAAESAAAVGKTAGNTEAKKLKSAAAAQSAQQMQAMRKQMKEKDDHVKLLLDEKAALEKRVKDQQKTIKEMQRSVADLEAGMTKSERLLMESAQENVTLREKADQERAVLLQRAEAMAAQLSAWKEERDTALGRWGGAEPAAADAAVAGAPPRDGTSRWREPSLVHPILYSVPSSAELKFASDNLPNKAHLFDWNYDVAGAADIAPSIYQCVATAAAEKLCLFSCTAANGEANLRRWQTMAAMVEANYRDNPYHNAVHAADVTHGVCTLLLAVHDELTRHMTRVEKLGTVFAALVHDVRHPGRSRDFLRNTFDPTYLSYNDLSVLEQMHAATSFALLAVPEADFTVGMGDDDLLAFHHVVTSLVLATDMSRHGDKMEQWQSKSLGHAYNFAEASDRLEVLALFLHAADIGAQSKGPAVAARWLSVVEEMYQQGDEERARKLPVSAGGARPPSSVPSPPPTTTISAAETAGQLWFMRAFVIPTYQVIQVLVPSFTAPMNNLKELYALYQQRCDGDTQPFPPALEPAKAPADPCGSSAGGGQSDEGTQRPRTPGDAETSSQRNKERAEALRAAYDKVRSAAADVAARDAAVRRKEDALQALEMRVVEGLRGLSAARNGDGPAAETGKATEGSGGGALVNAPDTAEIEKKLLRATARVVEKERQVRSRAVELDKQAKDLEERERLTAALSDQLAAIAERVNRQRRKLTRREAQLASSLRDTSDEEQRSIRQSLSARSHGRADAVMALRRDKDTILQSLNEAVQHLSHAVTYAP